MSDELLSIASFQNPLEANMAKNRLEAAGIPAFLSGEEAATMGWPFTSAAGGIRLHVAAEDAYRANACLAGADPSAGLAFDPSAPPADPTGITQKPMATALGVDATSITKEPDEPVPPEEDEEEESSLSEREKDATRAMRGAALGVLFLPIHLYVFYLLLKVYFSDEALSPTHRRHAWIATFINVPIMFLLAIVVLAWFAD